MQKKEEKMYSALLVIIYLAFISLGLPDTLLGSAWPQMHIELNASLSSAGIITMIISMGTVISSLFSDRLNIKLGTGKVTAISVLMTAVALLGFSLSHSFIILCVLAVPYGLGAGAVDAALNNYVALHYSSKHMSWLHCFWGVGAPIYPSVIHSTPFNFGADNSQAVIGIQMAFAYVGTTFMPPLFGLIAQYINIGLFPVYILIFTAIMLLTTEVLNNINKDKAYK